jgi:hypothetical protein
MQSIFKHFLLFAIRINAEIGAIPSFFYYFLWSHAWSLNPSTYKVYTLYGKGGGTRTRVT